MAITMYKKVAVVVFCSLAVSGCQLMGMGTGVGSAPAKVPPRIVSNVDNPSERVWNSMSAFGPVPAELREAGARVCGEISANHYAAGYHPGALDYEGKPFDGGGYLCLERGK